MEESWGGKQYRGGKGGGAERHSELNTHPAIHRITKKCVQRYIEWNKSQWAL